MVRWNAKELAAWEPKPPMGVVEWAEKNLYLPREVTGHPGYFRVALTPYLREPFECFTDRRIDEIALCFSTQTSKTTFQQVCMSYGIAYDPGPIIVSMPNANVCRFTSKNRIQPLIRKCSQLREKFVPENKWSLQEMAFDGGVLTLIGVQSSGQTSSRPARYLFPDESAKYPLGALDEVKERCKAQPLSKIVEASTPGQEGDNILTSLKYSDYRKYFVPCPYCGLHQVLDFRKGMKWPHEKNGRSVRPEEARVETWYECEGKQCRLEDRNKSEMLDRGRWVKRGQRIVDVTDDKLPGDVVGKSWSITLADGRQRKYCIAGKVLHNASAGFWINGLYSPFVSWGKLVSDFLKAKDDPSKLKVFVTSVLAEPWKEKQIEPDADLISQRIDTELPPKVIPPGYDFLLLAGDYHGPQYGVRFTLWAVRSDYAMAMIDYGRVNTLDEFTGLMHALYPEMDTGLARNVDWAVIDSGWETATIYQHCLRTPRTMPIKGVDGRAIHTVSTNTLEKMPNGKPIPGGMRLMMAHSGSWKDVLQLYLAIEWTDRRQSPPARNLRFHRDTGQDYVESLTSEIKRERTDKRGRVTTEWVVKNAGKNHYLDATIYTLALASWLIPQLIEVRRRDEEERRQNQKKQTQGKQKGSGWEVQRW